MMKTQIKFLKKSPDIEPGATWAFEWVPQETYALFGFAVDGSTEPEWEKDKLSPSGLSPVFTEDESIGSLLWEIMAMEFTIYNVSYLGKGICPLALLLEFPQLIAQAGCLVCLRMVNTTKQTIKLSIAPRAEVFSEREDK